MELGKLLPEADALVLALLHESQRSSVHLLNLLVELSGLGVVSLMFRKGRRMFKNEIDEKGKFA